MCVIVIVVVLSITIHILYTLTTDPYSEISGSPNKNPHSAARMQSVAIKHVGEWLVLQEKRLCPPTLLVPPCPDRQGSVVCVYACVCVSSSAGSSSLDAGWGRSHDKVPFILGLPRPLLPQWTIKTNMLVQRKDSLLILCIYQAEVLLLLLEKISHIWFNACGIKGVRTWIPIFTDNQWKNVTKYTY